MDYCPKKTGRTGSKRCVFSLVNIFQTHSKAAVERYLTIIGEAVHLFSKEPLIGSQLSSATQIISFRNRLVHAYDAIDDAIVWAAVKKGLPKLKKEVIALLETP